MSTWGFMVGATEPGATEPDMYACLYCGVVIGNISDSKTICVDEIIDRPVWQDSFGCVYKNVLETTAAMHLTSTPAISGNKAMTVICNNCSNCMSRRAKHSHSLLPMQELKWRINTLEKTGKKSMDTRVLIRLATSLTLVHNGTYENYYMTGNLFSGPEKKLIRDIVAHSQTPDTVDALIASYVRSQNCDTIFMNSNKVVEFLRQHSK